MSNRLIMALAGPPQTGKSTIAEYLHDEHDFLVFEGSSYMQSAANEQGVRLTSRADYDTFHRAMQVQKGLTWLADCALGEDTERLVFSGLRTRPNSLRLQAAGGVIIGLACPPEICVGRADLTNPKNAKTPEDYEADLRTHESNDDNGSHCVWVTEHANVTLDTSQPIAVTFREIDVLIDGLTS